MYKSARRITSWEGVLLAENFMCCLLAEIRELALALYRELISIMVNACYPVKFGTCIKNRTIQELSHRTTGQGSSLCSWAKHFTLIVPLSTQVYKWVPANLLLGVAL